MIRKIQSLQSWRFFAFLGIFLWHIKPWVTTKSSTAAFGVSFFIVLSGFLASIHYYDKIETSYKIIDCLKFAKRKISKIYLLHIVTLLFAVGLTVDSLTKANTQQVMSYIKTLIANIFLFQSWIPDPKYYFSFNGVAWYLSLSVFLYLMTFPLLRLIKKYLTTNSLRVAIIWSIIIFEFIYTYLLTDYTKATNNFFVYIFPMFRIFEYFAGCILGRIYIDNELKSEKDEKYLYTTLEILALFTVLIGLMMYRMIPSSMKDSAYWLPITLIVIFVFAYERGFVSKIISNKVIVHLGNISAELFLIHQLVIKFIIKTKSFAFLPISLLPIVALIISIIASEIFHKLLSKKFKTTRSANITQ